MQQLANASWRVVAPPPRHRVLRAEEIRFSRRPRTTSSIIVAHKIPFTALDLSDRVFPPRFFSIGRRNGTPANFTRLAFSFSRYPFRLEPPTSNANTPRYGIDSHETGTNDRKIACWTGSTAARKFLVKVSR